MLGQPALVARHHRGDAERQALLAEQRVAAVARAVGPDLPGLREVHDVLVLGVAGPGHVLDPVPERHAHRVEAGHELPVVAQDFQGAGAHAGHDPHAHGHVGRVRELHPDVRDRRAERAHREGHHVHGAAAHGAGEEVGEHLPHLGGIAPVVGGTGVLLVLRADEGAVLDPGHVARIRAGQEGARPLGLGEGLEGPRLHQLVAQTGVLLVRSVAPVDRIRGGQLGGFLHPAEQFCVSCGGVRAHPARSFGHPQTLHSHLG